MKIEITDKKPLLVIRPSIGYAPYIAFHQNKDGNFTIYFIESLTHKITIDLSAEETENLVEWVLAR